MRVIRAESVSDRHQVIVGGNIAQVLRARLDIARRVEAGQRVDDDRQQRERGNYERIPAVLGATSNAAPTSRQLLPAAIAATTRRRRSSEYALPIHASLLPASTLNQQVRPV